MSKAGPGSSKARSAEEGSERVGVLDRHATALALMRQWGMSGVAEKDRSTATPSRESGNVGQCPKAHVTFDVSHEIQDALVPSVGAEELQRLVPCRVDAIDDLAQAGGRGGLCTRSRLMSPPLSSP